MYKQCVEKLIFVVIYDLSTYKENVSIDVSHKQLDTFKRIFYERKSQMQFDITLI